MMLAKGESLFLTDAQGYILFRPKHILTRQYYSRYRWCVGAALIRSIVRQEEHLDSRLGLLCYRQGGGLKGASGSGNVALDMTGEFCKHFNMPYIIKGYAVYTACTWVGGHQKRSTHWVAMSRNPYWARGTAVLRAIYLLAFHWFLSMKVSPS